MKQKRGVKVSFAETKASVAPAVVSVGAVARLDEVDVCGMMRPRFPRLSVGKGRQSERRRCECSVDSKTRLLYQGEHLTD